jgi:hypothetical protein
VRTVCAMRWQTERELTWRGQVNNRIYPVWTYAYLAFLAVVGPAAELVGYKPVIVTGALAVVTTRALLIWATVRGGRPGHRPCRPCSRGPTRLSRRCRPCRSCR